MAGQKKDGGSVCGRRNRMSRRTAQSAYVPGDENVQLRRNSQVELQFVLSEASKMRSEVGCGT